MNMDLMHLHIYLLSNKGFNDNMVWWHWYQGRLFEKILMAKILYVFWIMVFFSLSHFFSESNNLKAHISDWSSPWNKLVLEFFYNEILIITCKMTYVIQGILPSHCLHSVN
jgi:hypothetical protein